MESTENVQHCAENGPAEDLRIPSFLLTTALQCGSNKKAVQAGWLRLKNMSPEIPNLDLRKTV